MPEIFQPMAKTVMITWTGHRALDLRNMVHCYHYDGATPTIAELNSLCAELITNLLPKIVGPSCNDLTWESVAARVMDSVGGSQVLVPISTGGQGTRAGFSLPGNVAVVISWRTGRAGRSYRGRTYVGNLSEGDVEGDTYTSGLLTKLAELGAEMLVSRLAGRFFPAVGSRKLNLSTIINSFILEPTVDSQRRRLAGRGA